MALDCGALSSLLNTVRPTHPVTLDDISAIKQLIEDRFGKLRGLEIFHRFREVYVRVFTSPTFKPDYEYRMSVDGAPPPEVGRR